MQRVRSLLHKNPLKAKSNSFKTDFSFQDCTVITQKSGMQPENYNEAKICLSSSNLTYLIQCDIQCITDSISSKMASNQTN